MAIASDIAKRSFRRLLVEADEAPLVGTEYADFYDAMNDYMFALDASGIRLGYTAISAGTDTVTVPMGAIRGIIANMALEVAPDYGGNVTPELQVQARDGLKTMRRLGMQLIQVKYPTNLPMGSGRSDRSFRDYDFYGVQTLAVLSINAPVIFTPLVTATQYKITGPWNIEAAKGLRADLSGVIENLSADTLDIDITLTMNLTGSGTYLVYVTNGSNTEVLTSSSSVAPSATAVTLTGMLTMRPGDYMEVRYKETAGTDALTVNEAHLRLS